MVTIVMSFRDWALDFAEGSDEVEEGLDEVEEVQVSIDPVIRYARVLRIVRVITILFTVHRARRIC